MRGCIHEKGDIVNGYWLCARCYQKLHERPSKLTMRREIGSDHGPKAGLRERQDVVYAPIAVAPSGLTLGQFVEAMAFRLMAQTRGAFTKPDALDYAVEVLRNVDEVFGSEDIAWDTEGAWDLVHEDMRCWDCDESRGNGG